MIDEEANQKDDMLRMDHTAELKLRNAAAVNRLTKLSIDIPANLILIDTCMSICEVEADAIVNSANEVMMGGGGMDFEIRQRAGPGLARECEMIPVDEFGVRCYTGKAVVTGAYDLQHPKYIIHTVAPYLDTNGDPQPSLLRDCYVSCMEAAQRMTVSSVAFPSLGTGYYGYPIAEAAEIAITTLCDCIRGSQQQGMSVFIVPYSSLDREAYRKLLRLSLL